MDIRNIYGDVIYSAPNAKTQQEALNQAVAEKVPLRGWVIANCTFPQRITLQDCTVSDCTVSGGTVSGGRKCTNKPAKFLRGFKGLYRYNVWAVLFEDGSRWVRMGCLFKSLEDWEAEGGIRASNISEFPDDGSSASEDRIAAFEFAKAAALRMK